MAASIFIYARDPDELLPLADDLEALDELTHLELDVLETLDFSQLPGGDDWAEGEPVVLNEGGGLAVFKVAAEGLRKVIPAGLASDAGDEQLADFKKLQAFVSEHGADDIYELATF